MKIIRTDIHDVVVLQPKVFQDERGFFKESFNARAFADAVGYSPDFVQDNQSKSTQGVLRGLHYQVGDNPQGKLVSVVQGEIFDVAVDLRQGSPTFGDWVSRRLSDSNHEQLWVPAGFAHGFLVMSETAHIMYKTTGYYSPEDERSIRWDDPTLAIEWPDIVRSQLVSTVGQQPILSAKDKVAPNFSDAEYFA